MTKQPNLIDDLNDAVATKNLGRRAEMLRRIAGLFVSGSGEFTGEQIALFDDVMGRLVNEIDSSARAALSQWLSETTNAPPKVLRTLALDDAIGVSGPILTNSKQLTEATVMEVAKTKGQDHLLAISRRSSIPEAVTDVLVDRGNQQVALSTVANSGAKFSEHGYTTLVKRAKTDDDLALKVWARPEVPRQHLLKLFADASEAVRLKLQVADRSKEKLIQDLIAQASNKIQTEARKRFPDYGAISAHVKSLYDTHKLDEAQLTTFANDGKFDATAIALALMSDLSIDLTERLMVQKQPEQIIIVARSLNLSWNTTKAILEIQESEKSGVIRDLEVCWTIYVKMTPELAKKALNFYRMREQGETRVPGGLGY